MNIFIYRSGAFNGDSTEGKKLTYTTPVFGDTTITLESIFDIYNPFKKTYAFWNRYRNQYLKPSDQSSTFDTPFKTLKMNGLSHLENEWFFTQAGHFFGLTSKTAGAGLFFLTDNGMSTCIKIKQTLLYINEPKKIKVPSPENKIFKYGVALKEFTLCAKLHCYPN